MHNLSRNTCRRSRIGPRYVKHPNQPTNQPLQIRTNERKANYLSQTQPWSQRRAGTAPTYPAWSSGRRRARCVRFADSSCLRAASNCRGGRSRVFGGLQFRLRSRSVLFRSACIFSGWAWLRVTGSVAILGSLGNCGMRVRVRWSGI